METKVNLELDKFNRPLVDEDCGIELLYNNTILDDIEFSNTDDARQYNFLCSELAVNPIKILQELDVDVKTFHKQQQDKWFIPEHYKTLNIEEHIAKCLPKDASDEALKRISIELELYKTRNLYPVLRVLIYIIDTMRKHNLVWGVGRGSSVASYVLYLIGVHKVDSLKYNLDIKEFLKDE
tara:strand:- start:1402 stop:1944 length:543 start_codon:yes stop_codon:yes gene_type:complete